METKKDHRMNFIPSLYAKTNFFQTRDAFALINDILYDFKDRQVDTVLDIGCGPGTQSYELFRKLKPRRMVAFDLSHGMIEEAKARYNGKQQNNGTVVRANGESADGQIEFFQCSASEDFEKLLQKVDIKAGSVDLIFSTYCIHWIPKDERPQFVDNVYRLLKPGGSFYLLKYTWGEVMEVTYRFIDHPKWGSYIRERVEKTTGVELIDANFEQIIGFNPLVIPREQDDLETWQTLFKQRRLFLEQSAFIRKNFKYSDPEDVINQFNQPYWRPYIEADKLTEFDADYRQFLMDKFVNRLIMLENERKQLLGTHDTNSNCRMRFNYIYTLFVGKKFA